MKNVDIGALVRDSVREALAGEFASVLHDITYRIDSLMQMGLRQAGLPHKITSEMMSLSVPMLDGFTFTDNSPSAGYIAWADCNIMYKGVKYTVTNGSTNLKYIYWTLGSTPTTFKTSATKPTLTDDDILVCVNNAGLHQIVVGEGRMVNGAIVIDGSVSSNELGSGVVTTAKIANLAITSGLLANNAVIAGKIATDAVDAAQIKAGAVVSGKIGADAVGTAQIVAGAVTGSEIAADAVGTTHIVAGAVTGTEIASGAVDSTQLKDGSVLAAKIGAGQVGTTQLADGGITNVKIGSGAVASDKLSIAMHLLY